MGRKSSISTLPSELTKAVAGAREKGATIDQIVAKLKQLGAEVSRSAVGRYVKNHDEITAQMRRSRELAAAVVKDLGERDDKARQLIIELVNARLFDLVTSGDDLDASDLSCVALALGRAAKAEKDSVATVAAAKEQAKKEALEEVKQNLATAHSDGDLSEEGFKKAINVMGFAL